MSSMTQRKHGPENASQLLNLVLKGAASPNAGVPLPVWGITERMCLPSVWLPPNSFLKQFQQYPNFTSPTALPLEPIIQIILDYTVIFNLAEI